MAEVSNLAKLAELAKETSSERRRELLREVTDMYFANQNTCSDVENEHFAEILTRVTNTMHEEVRKEMSERFAKENTGPIQLLHQLANDDYDIAGPVLRHSTILQDKHLKEVIANKGQQHLQAISSRDVLSQDITGDIVKKADDETLIVLAGNQGARFDRSSMETMVDRSEQIAKLQDPLVEHQDLAPDLMNDMYFFANSKIKDRILTRIQDIDPQVLEKALAQAQRKAIKTEAPRPKGFVTTQHQIRALHRQGGLNGVALVKFERENNRLKFTLGLAQLASVDYDTIDRILQRADTDALALVCRAIGFDSSLFATLALLTSQDDNANTGDTGELRKRFGSIPETAAKRTLRFWQMRQKLESDEAA